MYRHTQYSQLSIMLLCYSQVLCLSQNTDERAGVKNTNDNRKDYLRHTLSCFLSCFSIILIYFVESFFIYCLIWTVFTLHIFTVSIFKNPFKPPPSFTWIDRTCFYAFIINSKVSLCNFLPYVSDEYKTETNKVKTCIYGCIFVPVCFFSSWFIHHFQHKAAPTVFTVRSFDAMATV